MVMMIVVIIVMKIITYVSTKWASCTILVHVPSVMILVINWIAIPSRSYILIKIDVKCLLTHQTKPESYFYLNEKLLSDRKYPKYAVLQKSVPSVMLGYGHFNQSFSFIPA